MFIKQIVMLIYNLRLHHSINDYTDLILEVATQKLDATAKNRFQILILHPKNM